MEDQGGLTLSRRTFIITSTGAVAALYLPAGCGTGGSPPPTLTFTTQLTRREDFLRLQFDFWNLEVVPSEREGEPARLRKPTAGSDSYLVVGFAPQHLNEEAFLETSPGYETEAELDDGSNLGETVLSPPIQTRLAGPSRLAFLVPDDSLPLDYTTRNLLTWATFTQRVAPHALGPDPEPTDVRPVEPSETQTAIEMPWHLLLSPHAGSAWAHADRPVMHTFTSDSVERDIYELWHTRLGVRRASESEEPSVDELDPAGRTIRAVWALDEQFETHLEHNTSPVVDDVYPRLEEDQGPAFRQAVDDLDRYDIVRLSSDFGIEDANVCPAPITLPGGGTICPDLRTYTPTPVDVRLLMLSSLGGWIDARGAWDLPTSNYDGVYNSSLQEWRHRGTMGRDQYVRIVRKGFLFPFGHRASLIKISERKFERVGPDGQTERGAYLRQRVFIVVRDPVRRYAGDANMPHNQRRFPFTSLRCQTLVTPNLDPRAGFAVPGDSSTFVARVGGQPHPFHFVGTDRAGQLIDFTCPIVFVDSTVAAKAGDVDKIIEAYEAAMSLRDRPFEGQGIALAPHGNPGDTTVKVREMRMMAQRALLEPESGDPGFFPAVETFSVELPEVQAVAGKPLAPPVVSYTTPYLDEDSGGDGFGGTNVGEVFLETAAAVPLNFHTASSGGVVTPTFGITALSRKLGPVGGQPAQARVAQFDPTEIFGLDDAKLLGGVSLKEILEAANGAEHFPALVTRQLDQPRRIETVLDWHTTTKPDGLELYRPKDGPDGGRLHLVARTVSRLDDPDQSTFSVTGELREFFVNLFGDAAKFVRLDVRQLRFTAARNQKPDVDVDLLDVSFHGPLEYLADLAEYMAFGDGSGISIRATGEAIVASLTLTIPNVPAGAVTMSNLAFSGGISIPFDGSPVRARFAFSSREDPFTLTVLGLGGSGFVAAELGADGVELLEFALAFGGSLELDVAVASGRVSIMGGFHFSVETLSDKTQNLATTLYVDFEGEVSVLGLVTVCLELHVSLSYISCSGALEGEASATVSIDVLGFGGSATIRVRKTFAGGGGSCDDTAGLTMPSVSLAGTGAAVAPGGVLAAPAGAALAPPGLAAPEQASATTYTWGDFIEEPHWHLYADAFALIEV